MVKETHYRSLRNPHPRARRSVPARLQAPLTQPTEQFPLPPPPDPAVVSRLAPPFLEVQIMRHGFIFALAIAVIGVSLLGGCSKNEAASSKCGASSDSSSCNSCCRANGANGYKYTGAGTCGCLGGTDTSSAPAPGGGTTTNFAGTYKSNWGTTVFTQTGANVNATYARGTVTCVASGPSLDCDWREGAASGKARLTKDSSGAIKGTWGNRASATDGGPWLFSP